MNSLNRRNGASKLTSAFRGFLPIAVMAFIMVSTAQVSADVDCNEDPDPELCCNGKPATKIGAGFISGGSGDDVIIGSDGKDLILGGSGDDTICGGGDNDDLWGGSGDDYLFGEKGDDRLRGGSGSDVLDGGDQIEGDRCKGGSGENTLDNCEKPLIW